MDRRGEQVGVIGIDFGTTNCCAAIYTTSSGSPEVRVLENQEGARTTASFVFFTEKNKSIVGNWAKKMADSKPEYSVSEIKRLLGKKFDDPAIRNNMGYFPFDLHNVDNVPTIKIHNANGEIQKTPEELATIILAKIKEDVEAKFEKNPADKAVITVPAYFSSAQREAVLRSAQNAGFTVLQLLNEPTAAALCYFYHRSGGAAEPDDKMAVARTTMSGLVFDLGGGTFDVAILRRSGENVTILAVDGDTYLGGQDFDNLLVDHVLNYLEQNHGYDPNGASNHRVLRILKSKCEEAKVRLSFAEETSIELTALPDVRDNQISVPITRKQLEDLASGLFARCISIVGKCLEKSGLGKGDMDVVILSGGSTRIPLVQKMLSDFFDGKTLNKSVPPEECVAEGAAILGAMLSTHPLQKIDRMRITDVVPLSLGIGFLADVMEFVIPRNTPIPVSRTITASTIYDKQTGMMFHVFEGERLNVNHNYYLGKLEISNLTSAPPGQCGANITMSVDKNGILTLTVKEQLSENEGKLKFVYTRGIKSDDEISAALQDARENQADDAKFKEFADHKVFVIKYCVRAIYNFEAKQLVTQFQNVYDECKKILGKVKLLTDFHQTVNVLALRRQVFELCENIAKNHNFNFMPKA